MATDRCFATHFSSPPHGWINWTQTKGSHSASSASTARSHGAPNPGSKPRCPSTEERYGLLWALKETKRATHSAGTACLSVETARDVWVRSEALYSVREYTLHSLRVEGMHISDDIAPMGFGPQSTERSNASGGDRKNSFWLSVNSLCAPAHHGRHSSAPGSEGLLSQRRLDAEQGKTAKSIYQHHPVRVVVRLWLYPTELGGAGRYGRMRHATLRHEDDDPARPPSSSVHRIWRNFSVRRWQSQRKRRTQENSWCKQNQ